MYVCYVIVQRPTGALQEMLGCQSPINPPLSDFRMFIALIIFVIYYYIITMLCAISPHLHQDLFIPSLEVNFSRFVVLQNTKPFTVM